MNRLAAFCILPAAVATAALAQNADEASGIPARTPEQVWASSCGYCHGGPMNAPQLRGRGLPEQLVVFFVRNGANGMPPFHQSELDDETLQALARWIHESPAPPSEQPR